MSTPTSGRSPAWAGIALGLVVLGLIAVFAIVLPEVADDESGDVSSEPVSLPDSLPGGYPAADDPAAFDGTDYADQAEDIAKQQRTATDYGNTVLPDALGHPAATRTYVADGTIPVFVQVFRAEGGALAPQVLTDPTTTQGQGGTTMERVGDAACVLTYGASQGDDLGDPTDSQCQISRSGLTVQIQASGLATQDLVDAGDALLDDLVDQDQ